MLHFFVNFILNNNYIDVNAIKRPISEGIDPDNVFLDIFLHYINVNI